MRPYRVPAAYRDRWVGRLDPRLRRMLKFCAAVHVALLAVLLVVPKQEHELQRRRLPRERVARMLAPKLPPPPPRLSTPAPRPVQSQQPKPPRAARAERPRPKKAPTAQPTTPRAQRSGPAKRPAAGERGRAAGRAVAQQVEDTTARIDDMLSGLTGTVPAASGSGSGAGSGRRVASGVESVGSGRAASQLASIDGLLEGTGAGAGAGATSQGVARAGIDVVDEGLSTEGAGSTAWGRDSRSLMAVVQRYKSGVKFCYDNTLKQKPSLQGKITLQMDILASGAVSELRVVGDTLSDPELQRCILAQVRNWRFEAIDAGTVRFTLPLVFSPPR